MRKSSSIINLQTFRVMRKISIFLAAIVVGMTFASCANDDFMGESSGTTSQTKKEAPIVFSGGASSLTRADLYGSAAATKLGNKFVVYGIKHANAETEAATNDAIVFNNFQVEYAANTAGKTESNSSDWEYVGKQSYDAQPQSQGIKYWDYDANEGYTFYAFSYHKDAPTDEAPGLSYPANSGKDDVSVVKTTSDATSLYNKGYAVTVKPAATLNNLYFSDRVPVAETNYDKTVTFTFRNIGSKVRVGFYETIPGYDVFIDIFYTDEDADPDAEPSATAPITSFAAMKDAKTNGFYAALQNVKTSVNQTLNVTYYGETTATQVINRPKLTNPTAGYNYSLKLGNGSGIIGKTLATDAASPTWVAGKTADNFYIPVFPFETNTTPMLVKLDFTMTANDGSNDTIHVKGARAIVPAEYVKWKSNFAYTYIFKISDKTNGTTGKVDVNGDPEDPEGLKAITFDAIVVDVTDERQETITTFSTNSITTYAEGAIADEYKTGKPIYVAVSDQTTHNVITPSGIGDTDGKAQVYKLSKAVSEAEVLAFLTGSPIDGLTLTALSTPAASVETTIPLVDGTNPAIANVKFTPSASGYYVYVYTTHKYVAPTYTIQTNGTYDSTKTYYLRSGAAEPYVYFAVPVPTEAAFDDNKTQLYLQTSAGTAGEYDVKVIKVED